MSNDKKLIVIVGPTASGKSALAVRLAKRYNGEIISADSRQIYKGLKIGSGVVTKKETAGIPHHLIGIINPKKIYTAADYKKAARKEMERIWKRGKLPIMVGGTGLYIRAAVDGLVIPEVKPNPKLRKRLEGRTAEELSHMLKKMDLRRWREIDKQNPRRLIRAIEIADALGKVPKLKMEPLKAETLFLGVKKDKDDIKRLIYKRLISRLKHGMIAEVEKLHRGGLSWKRLEDLGLEYRYLARFLQGKMKKDKMTDQLYKEIVKYAKRQMTWFGRDERIIWVKNRQEAVRKTRGFLAK